MASELVCFTVEFDGGIAPKRIWAHEFRTTADEMWVEFLDADGIVVSTVRMLNIVAIDRVCNPGRPGAERAAQPSGPRPSTPQVPPQATPGAAGPVEEAARQAAAAGRSGHVEPHPAAALAR